MQGLLLVEPSAHVKHKCNKNAAFIAALCGRLLISMFSVLCIHQLYAFNMMFALRNRRWPRL